MLPCMAGCIIKCAILFNDAAGAHVTTALEFETIALLGSNLEVDDIDAVAADGPRAATTSASTRSRWAMRLAWRWRPACCRGATGAASCASSTRDCARHGAGPHHRRRHRAVARTLRHRPRAGGEGPGPAGVGAAHAEGDGRHLRDEPAGRRPHGRARDGARRHARDAREGVAPRAAGDGGGRFRRALPVLQPDRGRHGALRQRACTASHGRRTT